MSDSINPNPDQIMNSETPQTGVAPESIKLDEQTVQFQELTNLIKELSPSANAHAEILFGPSVKLAEDSANAPAPSAPSVLGLAIFVIDSQNDTYVFRYLKSGEVDTRRLNLTEKKLEDVNPSDPKTAEIFDKIKAILNKIGKTVLVSSLYTYVNNIQNVMASCLMTIKELDPSLITTTYPNGDAPEKPKSKAKTPRKKKAK